MAPGSEHSTTADDSAIESDVPTPHPAKKWKIGKTKAVVLQETVVPKERRLKSWKWRL